ncbi:hypothetical protein JG687_00001228 [Phytophthora cactorum]|uniref:Uncharacterized protein n=2 Tax=Phytophthora cactorum TaxID=29920 RepID=A0A8T1V0G9_9STRA|nr:hypothetical protein JG687_00001228 [Phytophthora cactorum]
MASSRAGLTCVKWRESVLRIEGVHSIAWGLYESWTSSVGEADPFVLAHFASPLHLLGTIACPPNEMVGDIRDEANSIINLFAPLLMENLVAEFQRF